MPNSSTQLNDQPRYVAMDLAQAFVQDHDRDQPELADEVIPIFMEVAQLLAEQGHTGEWAQFDAAAYHGRVDHQSHYQLVLTFLHLSAIFVWMGDCRLIHPRRATEIVQQIKTLIPEEPLLGSLCDRGVELLASGGTFDH